MKKLSKYEQTLLDGWEDIYKKSQLTFWILLALEAGDKHMSEIKHFIQKSTNETLTVDDQSMYRALRRFADAELVTAYTKPSQSGPDLKVYTLTETGVRILGAFTKRNIVDIYLNPSILKRITKVANTKGAN
jgi:PadR family transcriptional regulator PadR